MAFLTRNSIWHRCTALALCGGALTGCVNKTTVPTFNTQPFEHYQRVATKVEYADLINPEPPPHTDAPLTLQSLPPEFWELSLEQAVQLTLQNSRVMRDLGGFVLRSPLTTRSVHVPAMTEMDPQFGVEAALAEFDTSFAARTSWEKNDRAINNPLLGGGTNLFKQDLGLAQYQLQKRAATGTLFTARHNTDYDANSAPANTFGSAWNTNFEAEVRQPLLQNAGVWANRTAGPNSTPGQYTGVLIARTNTDIAIADFEIGVRDLVSNVENAYWDLYFAYRDLDAKIAARNAALESWQRVQALNQTGRKGGEAEKEAEAREQYFRFQEEVQNALTGRLVDGTQTNNGSSGGSFRANGGVQVAERRLRLLAGLPISDGRLIRPGDAPRLSQVVFDWNQALGEALTRRGELRKQQWVVKRRELELAAARNFLLPNLDATGRYRFRGFGKDLLDSDSANAGRFDNAYDDLFTGDFQEWQLGLELNMPLGFRRGHAAMRYAQLQLARDRAILREQERDVQLGLSNAFAEVERAYAVAQTNYNRRAAAKEQLAAVGAAFEADKATLDLLLEGQRRSADAESRYHGALVDYALAIKNVHFEKGTLLDHDEITLAEGPWPSRALADAERRDGPGSPHWPLNYVMQRGPAIADGLVPQQTEPTAELASPENAPGTLSPASPGAKPNSAPEVLPTPPGKPTENQSTWNGPLSTGVNPIRLTGATVPLIPNASASAMILPAKSSGLRFDPQVRPAVGSSMSSSSTPTNWPIQLNSNPLHSKPANSEPIIEFLPPVK